MEGYCGQRSKIRLGDDREAGSCRASLRGWIQLERQRRSWHTRMIGSGFLVEPSLAGEDRLDGDQRSKLRFTRMTEGAWGPGSKLRLRG